MRPVLYILALYTLILSCLPCQDEVLLSSYGDTPAVVNTSTDRHEDAAVDLCSPFCICACCAGITLQESFTSLPEAAFAAFFEDKSFVYTTRSEGGDLTSIWQPPRI